MNRRDFVAAAVGSLVLADAGQSAVAAEPWRVDLGFAERALRHGDLGLAPRHALRFASAPAPLSNAADPGEFHLRWLLYAIQGMANRLEPLLWLGPAGLLGDYYEQRHGLRFVDRSDASMADCLRLLAPRFNGLVVYPEHPSDAAILALNVANQNYCLPVCERVLDEYRAVLAGLPVRLRIDGDGLTRERVYDWLTTELLPRCPARHAFSMNQAFADNAIPAGECSWDAAGDIPFGLRSFIFNLSGQADDEVEQAAFRRLMERLDAPALIFGWNTAEAVYSPFGHMMGHCQNAANGSFIAGVPVQGRFPFRQPARPNVLLEPKVYVAFVSNEGDTLRLMSHGYWGAWQRPERGSVPLTWAICPAYVEHFPSLMEYYYEGRTPNDYFRCGPSGAGYVHMDLMPPGKVDLFLSETQRLSHDYLDLHEIIAWGCNNHDVWRKMASQPNVAAVYPKPNGGPDDGRLTHVTVGTKTVPVLREGYGHYWITRTAAYNHDRGTQLTPELFAAELHALYDSLPRPAFHVLYSLEGEAPRLIKQVSGLLDPAKVQLVDLGTMSHLLKQAAPDCDAVPAEPAAGGSVTLTAELLRDAAVWQPVNGSRIASVANGLRIELTQTWGGVALDRVRMPVDATGLTIRVAEITRGNWEPRVLAHASATQPALLSTFVGIQVASSTDGPYPGGLFRSGFDPRLVAKIRRGELLPRLELVYYNAKPGDVLVLASLAPLLPGA